MTESRKKQGSITLVLHAGAIGDVVLGTLVPMALKQADPDSRVIYWTHESLMELLNLSAAIDDVVVWDKKRTLWQQLAIIRQVRPDRIVDLSASLRSRIICGLSGVRTYTYVKQSATKRPIVHAAVNFLQTISTVVGAAANQVKFPSLSLANRGSLQVVQDYCLTSNCVALVPGVGKLRSHRGWPADYWGELSRKLLDGGRQVILIGGPEDMDVAAAVCAHAPDVVNLCGKLTLAQTAAALSVASIVVSGDTGPSHIAVAVGTPVLGLLGPTFAERSGPFGCIEDCLVASNCCKCFSLKVCAVTGKPGSGKCMQTISVTAVLAKIDSLSGSGCALTS